jgi:hypothetical protein
MGTRPSARAAGSTGPYTYADALRPARKGRHPRTQAVVQHIRVILRNGDIVTGYPANLPSKPCPHPQTSTTSWAAFAGWSWRLSPVLSTSEAGEVESFLNTLSSLRRAANVCVDRGPGEQADRDRRLG